MNIKMVLNLLCVLVALSYAYFIFIGDAPVYVYDLVNGCAALLLSHLLYKGSRSLMNIMCLVWVVVNYIMMYAANLNPLWKAYDGFAFATFISSYML
jgi:hypothetical protein